LWVSCYCGGVLGWAGFLFWAQFPSESGALFQVVIEGALATFGLGIFCGMAPVAQKGSLKPYVFYSKWPIRASLGLLVWTTWLYFVVIPNILGSQLSGNEEVIHAILGAVWIGWALWVMVKSPSGYWRQIYGLLTFATVLWTLGVTIRNQVPTFAMAAGLFAMALLSLGLGFQEKAPLKPADRRHQVRLGGLSMVVFGGVFLIPLIFHLLLNWDLQQRHDVYSARQGLIGLHLLGMVGLSAVLWSAFQRHLRFWNSFGQEERDATRKVQELLETQILETTNKLDQTQSFLNEEISLRKTLEDTMKKREQRYQILVETMNEGLGVVANDMTFSYANDALCRMLGLEQRELLGSHLMAFFDEENRAILKAQLEKRALGIEESYEVDWTHQNGSKVSTQISPRVLRDKQGRRTGSFAVITDMTERKRVENELRIRLQFDPVTGLVNRTLFMERLNRSLLSARRDMQNVAVLILDLDRFKRINDSLGHDMGDALLTAVGGRLSELIDDWDTVSRLGSDEFGLILSNIQGPMSVVTKVERMQSVFSKPFSLRGRDVTVSSSIGISIWPEDGHSAQVLMNHADAAMHHAKSMGRNGYQFYTDSLNKAAFQRLEIENHLRNAFDRDELILHYQPKVDLKSGKMVGLEALIRWCHPDQGFLSPDVFIPIAEETGLIVRLSDWLMDTACRQVKQWQKDYAPRLTVGINLSANQFSSEDLVAKVLSVLSKNQLDPESFELEITESLAMENVERSISILQQLWALGVRVALDDFGTGHASLNYIKRFNFRTLKIDRCFIENAHQDPVDAAIVKAIIEMGHGLGLEVIAEGVEKKEQLEFLAAQGCDQIQGYLISPPLPAREIEALFAKSSLIPD